MFTIQHAIPAKAFFKRNMRKYIVLFVITVLLAGCQNGRPVPTAGVTGIASATASSPAEEKPDWTVYHSAPDHPWNRVFQQLYRRTAVNGDEYGLEELDPLLWFDTTHLLRDPSHGQSIQVLDEFLSSHAETLIREPLKRAMFQRDLWAVFDWLASQDEPYPLERQALQARLAQILRRVALSRQEIASLPDNYAMEVEAGTFPNAFLADHPETAFLPVGLFQPDSAWVSMGCRGGPIAITHTEAFPFFGRSVFLVFVRSSHGRAATLDFIESLNTDPTPVTAIGSEVALIRRMLLLDDQGEVVLSPLVETIQLRHFSPAQSFHEFELDRARLFDGRGGLVPNLDLFLLFMGHGDVFEHSFPKLQAQIPEICKACHSEEPYNFSSGNTKSIISYSRLPFSLPDNEQPILFPTTVKDEAQTVIEWKRKHATWTFLQALWHQAEP